MGKRMRTLWRSKSDASVYYEAEEVEVPNMDGEWVRMYDPTTGADLGTIGKQDFESMYEPVNLEEPGTA